MKTPLAESQLLHLTDPAAWRAWLEQNYQTANEAWLVYSKKHTAKARILYNDAVEEALCFGWIDSTVKSVDDERTAQRFSPRKPGSPYSQANIERLRVLSAQGRVTPAVLASLGDVLEKPFVIPPDILASIQADPAARENFQGFSDTYVRIRVAFIDAARKRPAEFEKRLRYFIKMSAQNKLFGFGGIEKYF